MDVDKADVARRHLGTALALYLDDVDPVSVHTLACAGAEVAEALSEIAGSNPFRFFRTQEQGREISDTQYYKIRNEFVNAFKHAKSFTGEIRDDSKILSAFSDVDNDERLFIGWFDFGHSGRSHPIESHVFQTWFLALHPSRLCGSDEGQALAQDLVNEFGGDLPTIPRVRQKKRLRESISRARKIKKLMADPLVDHRQLILRS